MKEYKVLGQSDSLWGQRFSPEALEKALNKLAREGWDVVTCTTTEFVLRGTKSHELIVVLEREKFVSENLPNKADDGTEGYDPSRIPIDRFYRDVGSVSSALKADGVVTVEQLDMARMEFAKRGGHLCDHLLAFGFVDEDDLRKLV